MGALPYQETLTDITKNPGYKLRELLSEICPRDNSSNFLSKIDDLVDAGGSFYHISYYSTLNYVLRRLINSAIFIKSRYSAPEYNAERYLNEIRSYLRKNYNFPHTKIEKIFGLLVDCIGESERTLSDGNKNVIKRKAQSLGYGCYICGKELIYNSTGYAASHDALVEVEHLWPKALGGSNEAYNLEVCCHQCNQIKKNHIDEYDYHFEEISLKLDEGDTDFNVEFNQLRKMATSLKDEPKCVICGKLALHQHRLKFKRNDINDSWHYLNMNTYCEQHAGKK